MTEKVDHSSNFSFRLFDLYRRFVEILQLHSDFLEDFKTGAPKEEICRAIIKKTFIHRQADEKIEQMITYLKNNAKFIASQVENKPIYWNEAINYTDTCIKLIRNYLRRKGISNKTNLDSINEVAKDISEFLYKTPNETQIEEITKYLEEDRKNPKKTIIPAGIPKKAKKNVKKTIDTQKIENLNLLRGTANLKIVTNSKFNQNESSQLSAELLSITNEEKIFEELKTDVQDKSEAESLKTKNTLQQLLLTHHIKARNEILHTEDSKSSLEDLNDLQDEVFIECDKLQDEEYIRNLFNKMKHKYPDEYVFIGIDETAESKSLEECEDRTEIASPNELRSCLGLKRKSIISTEDDDHHDIKKSFLSKDILKEEDDEYKKVNYNSSYNNYAHIAELEKLEDDYDSSDTEINVVDDEDSCESNLQVQNIINQQISNQDLPIEDIKNKFKKNEEKVMFQLKNQLKSTEEKCLEVEGNYSNILDLTYVEVLRLTELIMAFCELKNEISLEEFLVLRRIRDKMKWRSLKEFTK